MTEDVTSERSRVQVSMSSDLLALVRHVSAVTGESDSQVVLRGLTLALPDMVRGADEFRSRVQSLKLEQDKLKQRSALPAGKQMKR